MSPLFENHSIRFNSNRVYITESLLLPPPSEIIANETLVKGLYYMYRKQSHFTTSKSVKVFFNASHNPNKKILPNSLTRKAQKYLNIAPTPSPIPETISC